ncbi:MAG: outer membrane beta-barrel protein [Pseudomonadota bacterium]
MITRGLLALTAASTFVLGTPTIAAAADFGGMKDSPFLAQTHTAPSWTGFFAGLELGYAWGDHDWTFVNDGYYNDNAGDTASMSGDGVLAGAHIGYQVQWRRFVFGVEANLNSVSTNADEQSQYFNDDTFKTDIDWLATVAGRVGYTVNAWHGYLKGGFAFADVEVSAEVDGGRRFSDSDTLTGYVLGAGVDYRAAKNFVIGIEYNYISLDDERFAESDPSLSEVLIDADAELHTLKAKASLLY